MDWVLCHKCALIAGVRADERRRYEMSVVIEQEEIADEILGDLRAKAQALAVYLVDDQSEPGGPSIIHHAVSLNSVLALIDEATP